MKIHNEKLTDVQRYIENNKGVTLGDRRQDFEAIIKRVSRFKAIDRNTKFLEIGIGIGWFPILCKSKGISCNGLEISPELVEYSRNFGLRHGIELDIELGNIEDADIGESIYDVIVASSVFEHVEHWQIGLKRVFAALKPGGALYFCSTNKFSLVSGEFNFPLYGWLPDWLRYRLRIFFQGEDIIKLGIDFNQFNYCQLRRFFRTIGFSKVYDRFEFLEPYNLVKPAAWKIAALKMLKKSYLLRNLGLLFSSATAFICIK